MTPHCDLFKWVLLASLGANACHSDPDVVLPGYYAQEGAKAMTKTEGLPPSGQAVRTGQNVGSQAAAGVGTSVGRSGVSNAAGTEALAMATAAGPSGSSGSQAMQMKPQENASSAGQMATGMPTQTAPGTDPCDLTGRWLVTSHLTTDALGSLQAVHYYEYFEIAQQGAAFTVTRGFMCGSRTTTDSALSANVDFSAAEATFPMRVRYDGRPGTSTKVADGCQIEVGNWYTVRGVSIPFYLDPANKMPTGNQQATDTTPGWEDWDGDGNPGITGNLSGVISGKIFVGPRMWTAMSGTATDTSVIRLSVKWGQEQNMLGYEGSPLLETEAAIGPDPATHFAQLARLSADQATGDEKAICAAMIELAPKLTPEAAGP